MAVDAVGRAGDQRYIIFPGGDGQAVQLMGKHRLYLVNLILQDFTQYLDVEYIAYLQAV